MSWRRSPPVPRMVDWSGAGVFRSTMLGPRPVPFAGRPVPWPSALRTRAVGLPGVYRHTSHSASGPEWGGAPHATQSPRDLASCRFAWAWRSLFSLRFCLCSYSCRFCSLASTSAGVGSTRGFGFYTFWLALADVLLDLSLFGVRMTKVLSKMRSLEPPARSGDRGS